MTRLDSLGSHSLDSIGVREGGVRMLQRNLLHAAWLCCLLTVPTHSCPDNCSHCSGPEKERCDECRGGWMLYKNSCVDVDECGTEVVDCPPNSYCFNTEGSFECRDCDSACVGCMGSGSARCRKCASGYRLTGSKCLDVDECSDRVLACRGLDELCTNTAGSFRCDCAEGFSREDGACVKQQTPNVEEKGLFDDIRDDEVEVLRQMFFGVVLCALGTLAAKGDFVYTSVFMGALAAMAGYWLSDRGDHLLGNFLKGR
ncbi:protein disulfide isomerase Creld1 [Betta splendens]|uniref:Protein disulfide isomerase Creld1 n=1 Tax=Betta splendens TaxID=158456 RepID=A0A6P7MH42_BETSP|nr:protein disulfide isomerase Creld1 [Betta splendens]